VIPAIDGVILEKRPVDAVSFVFPTRCPVCGGETARTEGEVAIRCVNPLCPAQLQRRLEHFASRNALDIDSLGGKVADFLVEKGIVKDPLDLFTLNYAVLADCDLGETGVTRKFGKNAFYMRDAVERARTLPLDRWLFAIGIPQVGATVARDIAAQHAHLSDVPGSDLLKGAAGQAVLDFFASDYGRQFLARMAALGIDPARAEAAPVATTGPLAGAGCVLTGTLSRPRPEYAKMIEAAGGVVQSAVTSKTRYLIAGANVGATKTEKARKLGTEVIDEARLMELLSAAGQGDMV